MKSVYSVTALLSIILIIGLVYISYFNVYQTDDYIYAYTTKKLGFLGNMQEFYLNWGGRYFGYGYNMLIPLSQDPENILPKIYPVFLIFSFIVVSALNFKEFFKYSWLHTIGRGLVLFLFYTVILTNISEHLFWFTGSNIYFLPVIISGLLVFFCKKYNDTSKSMWYYMALLFIFILMGSNEILALIVFGIIVYWNTQNKSARARTMLIVGLSGLLISFLAPGNFQRMTESQDAFYLKWFKRIIYFGADTSYIFIKTAIIIPLFIKIFEKEVAEIAVRYDFKKRIMFWMISFLPLLFLGFIMNSIGRQFENIIFFWLLSSSVIIYAKINWIKKCWIFSLIFILLPQTNFFPEKYKNFNLSFNINTIAKEILYTDLRAYDKEISKRIHTLKTAPSDSVVLDKIKTVPLVLYFDEMSSVNENRDYVSMQLEKYFNKKYIRTK
ncbi:DUF6056 family protein [Chryseobacterium takakiae]|uniref:Dolichyl-phosphate-mannose-protein mannosyltransferase n=1 Tax=Chryseobacterium takakiae TaxID=1302685 RepID=A0A1M4YNG2_9FLAO|nr:DUF6056 family protein [Chryseobacterium takakiae]SHF07320.1 hypothetical protein SAMN05444408_108132 [Chryseobacterium takakiae]